jgi:hypothetical protein
VPVKKAKKAARSVRYVLSADQRFQKLSLRKMTERVKKGKQPSRSSRSKKPARTSSSIMRLPWAIDTRTIVLGAVCVVAAAALVGARQPSLRSDVANVDAQMAAQTPWQELKIAAPTEARKTVVPNAPRAVMVKTSADGSTLKKQPVESVKVPQMTLAAKPPLGESTPKPAALESTTKTLAAEPRARPLAPEVSPKAAAVELTATAEVQSVPAVTVTGCLAVDDETFWLKDPSGADAPKSRSWKSGFLKKRAAAIEVVDGARSLRLASYVGQRVAATGVLVDREMRARSLRPIAGSCD